MKLFKIFNLKTLPTPTTSSFSNNPNLNHICRPPFQRKYSYRPIICFDTLSTQLHSQLDRVHKTAKPTIPLAGEYESVHDS